MSDTATYTIHEGAFTVEAEVSYDIHPASGDGRWEPREPASVEIFSARLIKSTWRQTVNSQGALEGRWLTEDLGPAPQWVFDLINADDDFLNGLLEEEPEYEREYD